jgi:hypothetical protein
MQTILLSTAALEFEDIAVKFPDIYYETD